MKNSKRKSKICLKCQACCKELGIHTLYEYNDINKEFYEARGMKVSKYTFGRETFIFLDLDIPCPHLDDKKGCLIYKKRPENCKSFPLADFTGPGKTFCEQKCELYKMGMLD